MKLKLIGFILVISLTSCATYHLSTESLVKQAVNAKKETKVNFIVVFPLVIPGIVTGNDIRSVKCFDKNEIEHEIYVTNHTGIRITKKDSTRSTFYFDTLILKDSTINGAKSHFIPISIHPIKLSEISKIEMQK
jgi:hypothetical protein